MSTLQLVVLPAATRRVLNGTRDLVPIDIWWQKEQNPSFAIRFHFSSAG